MLEWMATYAQPGQLWTERPYALVIEGRPWSVVTNGKALVAVQGESEFAPPDSEADAAKLVGNFAPLITPKGEDVLVDLRALREWSAAPPCEKCLGAGEITCPECRGDGVITCRCPNCYDEHDSECGCDGGKETCACAICRPGRIGGLVVNLNYLAPLNNLPGFFARFYVGREMAPAAPHTFVGDGWVLAVMPLRNVDKDAPEFSLSAEVAR